jgi:hypothetical protein
LGFVITSPNPQLEDHSLSAACDFLFNVSAATLHIVGRSFIRNLRARRTLVTGNQLSRLSSDKFLIEKTASVDRSIDNWFFF